MKIGLIDTMTPKRANAGASVVLDWTSIPRRSIALGKGEVGFFEMERRGIEQKVPRHTCDLVRNFGEQPGFVDV